MNSKYKRKIFAAELEKFVPMPMPRIFLHVLYIKLNKVVIETDITHTQGFVFNI